MAETFRVVDSVTKLDASARGAVVVCGSHGALYPAWRAISLTPIEALRRE